MKRFNVVIILLLILMISLIFTACNEKSSEALKQNNQINNKPEKDLNLTKDNKEAFISLPKITVTVFAQYRYYDFDIIDSMIEIPLYTDEIHVRFKFNQDIDPVSAKKAVQLDKFISDAEINVYDKEILLRLKGIKVGNKYPIKLKDSIKNTNGDHLEQDITFIVIPKEATEAKYRLVGVEQLIDFPMGFSEIGVDGIEPQYTNEPKKIEVLFTRDVNRNTITKAIKNKLSEKDATYTLQWIDDKKVIIDIEKFNRNGLFSFPLSDSLDKNGFHINNDLIFNIDNKNELYSYDLNTNTVSKIKTFHDKRYSAAFTPYLNNYLLIADQKNEYLFDMKADRISQLDKGLLFPNYLSMGPWMSEIEWLDDQTVIYYKGDTKSIVTYSFKEKQQQLEIPLSQFIDTIHLFSLKASPDGSKIALANYEKDGHKIYTFSKEGKKIFESDLIPHLRKDWAAGEYSHINLNWLNNDELIYEAGTLNDDNLSINILKTNITSNQTEIILENAIEPVPLLKIEGVIVKKQAEKSNSHKNNYIIWTPNNLKTINQSYMDHLIMIDSNHLIFNRPQIIEKENEGEVYYNVVVLYNLNLNVEEIIGEGTIIGKSLDGTKIYFMSNQKFLQPIT